MQLTTGQGPDGDQSSIDFNFIGDNAAVFGSGYNTAAQH